MQTDKKKHLVVFTGAGISAESGIETFRGSGGMWNNYNTQEVASIEGWHKNKSLMLDFYNQRRSDLKDVQPNKAHIIIADLEKYYDVSVVTQNVDNLHERAGSTNVLHLHGELTKACNERKTEIMDIGYNNISLGEKAPDGSQLRPFIVWFGEAVPMLEPAIDIISTADIFVVIGSSLQVYPAAGLIDYIPPTTPFFLIDPHTSLNNAGVIVIKKNATEGMADLQKLLLSKEELPTPSHGNEENEEIKAIEEAIKNDPENPELWILKSEILAKLERYDEANDCQDNAMKLLGAEEQ